MSNDTLFPEDRNEEALVEEYKKEKTLQQELMEFLRGGNFINEEIYNKVLGGRSLTATVRNCEQRGMLEEGEYIYPYWVYDKAGERVRHFKLIRAYSDDELEEIVEERVAKRLKVLNAEWESLERLNTEWKTREQANENKTTTPSKLFEVPNDLVVESIYVGTKVGSAELMIMVDGLDKPLRKLLHDGDVRYLIQTLSPFTNR